MSENNIENELLDNVQIGQFSEILSEKYLAYALSTIIDRSLPDVRDGLKPVHRRIIYAMSKMKLSANSATKKSARVVGDVMGKYHPHGDAAIYDAMVRLSQDFSIRYPLVFGQGNFGNIDGDGAAAPRYTEAKMTKVAEYLLEGIENDSVNLRETYNNEYLEPEVLPAKFPNLLANGSAGIAVGMATNIPSHNVGEICQALQKLIKKPSVEVSELMEFIQGPDFPTGGIVTETKETITKAYETGKGSFRVRAKWEVEKKSQGIYEIIITEIPYQVQKARLIEKIADLIISKKLPILEDVRDESAEDIRVVIVPKNRNVDPEMLMEMLFKNTDLEIRFSMNMNVLQDGITPRVMNLKEILVAFLKHRQNVLIRRSGHRLKNIEARLEILEGYLIAYLNIDEVIHIIRNEDEPKEALMAKFKLTENQAEAILNMKLRSLRKLEEISIKEEQEKLIAEKSEIEALIADEHLQWKAISNEIKDIEKEFGEKYEYGARKTLIEDPTETVDVPLEAFIEKENITVFYSKKGWLRAVKGHVKDTSDVKYKEGDEEQFVLHANTTDNILFIAENGRFYTIQANKISRGKGFGEPITILIDIPGEVNIIDIRVAEAGANLLVATTEGKGFVVDEDSVIASTKNGKAIVGVSPKHKLVVCSRVNKEDDSIAVVGTNRKLLIFPISELPNMNKGKGVFLQKYKGAKLSDAKSFKLEEGLTWAIGSRVRTETNLLAWQGKRASAGRMAPNGFNKYNKF